MTEKNMNQNQVDELKSELVELEEKAKHWEAKLHASPDMMKNRKHGDKELKLLPPETKTTSPAEKIVRQQMVDEINDKYALLHHNIRVDFLESHPEFNTILKKIRELKERIDAMQFNIEPLHSLTIDYIHHLQKDISEDAADLFVSFEENDLHNLKNATHDKRLKLSLEKYEEIIELADTIDARITNKTIAEKHADFIERFKKFEELLATPRHKIIKKCQGKVFSAAVCELLKG